MIFNALHTAYCAVESRSRRSTGAMPVAAPLLQQRGLRRTRSVQQVYARSEDRTTLRQEELGHRVANLLQVVVCNLERTASGEGTLTITAVRDQVSAVCQLLHLLAARGADEQLVASYIRALSETLETLILRPAGVRLTVELDSAAEQLLLPARTLSDLGQLVAEAVMNAAKHAFTRGPAAASVCDYPCRAPGSPVRSWTTAWVAAAHRGGWDRAE